MRGDPRAKWMACFDLTKLVNEKATNIIVREKVIVELEMGDD